MPQGTSCLRDLPATRAKISFRKLVVQAALRWYRLVWGFEDTPCSYRAYMGNLQPPKQSKPPSRKLRPTAQAQALERPLSHGLVKSGLSIRSQGLGTHFVLCWFSSVPGNYKNSQLFAPIPRVVKTRFGVAGCVCLQNIPVDSQKGASFPQS